jgi:hypothetical protein
MTTVAHRWKPGVPKRWLYLLSGLIWSGVGLMLMRWAWTWSSEAGWAEAWPYDLVGLLVAIGTTAFFSMMVRKNLSRIAHLPNQPCLFAFQSWWSYPLVVFMMGLGLVMKASPLPRIWLAGVYLAIGGGLFFAGLRYFVRIAEPLQIPVLKES